MQKKMRSQKDAAANKHPGDEGCKMQSKLLGVDNQNKDSSNSVKNDPTERSTQQQSNAFKSKLPSQVLKSVRLACWVTLPN